MKETELAKSVIVWLKAQHWEVYQEVQPTSCARVADIVAVSGRLVWIIECKTSLSLALLEQSIEWRGYAHYISVAVPYPKRSCAGHRVADMFLRQHGIGKIETGKYGWSSSGGVDQDIPARLNRKLVRDIKKDLCEKHKTYAEAGNADGRRWTPFKNTVNELNAVVRDNPGICLKDAIDKTRHHYASDSGARASISQYLQTPNQTIIPGVMCKKEGRFLRLYPKI